MSYRVIVPLKGAAWNLVCARLIENFGLPGDKYIAKNTDTGIEFLFNDPEDAFRAQLMI